MKRCEKCGLSFAEGKICPMCNGKLVDAQGQPNMQNPQYAYQQSNTQNPQYAYQQPNMQNPQYTQGQPNMPNPQYGNQQQNIQASGRYTKKDYGKLFGIISGHSFGISLGVLIGMLVVILVGVPLLIFADLTGIAVAVVVISAFLIIVSLCIFIISAVNRGRFIKLCEAGYYESVLQEYKQPVQTYSGKLFLSNHFCFGGLGTVEALCNIIWIYGHTQTTSYYGIPVFKQYSVFLMTRENKTISIPSKKKRMDEQMHNIVSLIQANNPNVLIGYTQENQNQVKNYLKQRKQQH